ncbi:hypothetical protein ACIP98_22825 [Streptomyces sp. NPDC088354]|uniref:hypothetical protein n=1 Tax=unclassified Streptomyces TaxID=2593676 RepID=UPI0029B39417|nr:hypothetical protein [Streptomyces sp. MI02-7b]MDX3077268.1 hypothetical protein [Streptomyces sp. MI02-7b]
MQPRTRRRLAALAAATALGAAALTGCGAADAVNAVDKALDCATVAAQVAGDVQNLQNAVSNAGNDPQGAATALDQIADHLATLGDKTGNADVTKAVDDLQKAVDNARTAADAGKTPDLTPVADAAAGLSTVCTSG